MANTSTKRRPYPRDERAVEHLTNAMTLISLTLQRAEPVVTNDGPAFVVPVETLQALRGRIEAAIERLTLGLLCAGILAPHLHAQVPAITHVSVESRLASFVVKNPAPFPVHVELALHWDSTPPGGQVTLGPPVTALITPDSFTLPAGQDQTVRLLVRAPIQPGDLLRLVTLLVPETPSSPQAGNVRVAIVTRLITKVEVAP